MLSLNARARVPNKQVQAPFDSAPDLRSSHHFLAVAKDLNVAACHLVAE
jgi:hypothetical protein